MNKTVIDGLEEMKDKINEMAKKLNILINIANEEPSLIQYCSDGEKLHILQGDKVTTLNIDEVFNK